jgi:hypothetical protein
MKKISIVLFAMVLFSCAVKKKNTEVVKTVESLDLKESFTAVNQNSDLFTNTNDFATDYSFTTKKTYRLIDATKPGSVTDRVGKTYQLDNAEIIEESEQKNKQEVKTKKERSSQSMGLTNWNNEAVIFKVEDVNSTTEVERPEAGSCWWWLLVVVVVGCVVVYLTKRFSWLMMSQLIFLKNNKFVKK